MYKLVTSNHEIHKGNQVLVNMETGEFLPLEIALPEPIIKQNLPAIKTIKTIKKDKSGYKMRPKNQLKNNRETTLSLIARNPQGLSSITLASMIYSANPSAKEKLYVQDDCRFLRNKGLIKTISKEDRLNYHFPA